jgi:hypothetical protein
LRQSGTAISKSGDGFEPGDVLSKQKEVIESLTKEPWQRFMEKFGQAAKSDLCDKDGLLHKQREKYGDVSIKDALEVVGKILIQQMSFTTDHVSKLVVLGG